MTGQTDPNHGRFEPIVCHPDTSSEGRQLLAFEVNAPEFRPHSAAVYAVTVEMGAPAEAGSLVWLVLDHERDVTGRARELRLVRCDGPDSYRELSGERVSAHRHPFSLGRVIAERMTASGAAQHTPKGGAN